MASPIMVIDSGVGGLTVAKAIRRVLPAENIVYFGDTARVPYGSKSAATVTLFVRQIINFLLPQNPKHLVIACNTATALALPTLRAEFPALSISGVIEPGARAAVAAAGAKAVPVIGVIATDATIRSRAYERAILRRRNHAHLYLRSAPLLVPIVEEGRDLEDLVVRHAVRGYIHPFVAKNLDVLVLGCTHYPMLLPAIAEVIGSQVQIIDSAEQCAQDVLRRLRDRHALRPNGSGEITGDLRCYITDDSPRFAQLASRFLCEPVADVVCVSLDELQQVDVAPVPLRLRA